MHVLATFSLATHAVVRTVGTVTCVSYCSVGTANQVSDVPC
jgi:hypothetical protein